MLAFVLSCVSGLTYCSFTGTPWPTFFSLPTIPILHGPLLVMLIWHILPSEM